MSDNQRNPIMLKKTFSVLFLMFLVAQGTSRAEIQLARVFGDGMVLQREMAVPVWGRAESGEKVAVTFAGQTKEAVADKEGRWQVTLDPLNASLKAASLVARGAKAEVAVTLSVTKPDPRRSNRFRSGRRLSRQKARCGRNSCWLENRPPGHVFRSSPYRGRYRHNIFYHR